MGIAHVVPYEAVGEVGGGNIPQDRIRVISYCQLYATKWSIVAATESDLPLLQRIDGCPSASARAETTGRKWRNRLRPAGRGLTVAVFEPK